jgi:hypothetical protein
LFVAVDFGYFHVPSMENIIFKCNPYFSPVVDSNSWQILRQVEHKIGSHRQPIEGNAPPLRPLPPMDDGEK